MARKGPARRPEVGIRALREQAATFVKRAQSGDSVVITVNGEPVAELGPVGAYGATSATLSDLVTRGALVAARRKDAYRFPNPIAVHSGARIDQMLREVRG
ncbi:MAG: type II toxin-antitoxin system Phd/YefM family antitoxin [Ilumatobacteraceae bacterium]